jgi:hypothetical protein
VGRRRRESAQRERGSRTNLLSVVEHEVEMHLDVELVHVEECLPLMPALLQAKERGVRVRIALPLERDPGFPEGAWDLEPYLSRGIDVRWGPTVRDRRLIADGRQTYRLHGEWVILAPELEESPLASGAGSVQIFSGEVLDTQSQRAGLHRLDRLLFIRIWALGGQFPIYFSSVRTSVDRLARGDCIKVLSVINWSGSGLFSAFAPSALYYEGVDFKPIACPEAHA